MNILNIFKSFESRESFGVRTRYVDKIFFDLSRCNLGRFIFCRLEGKSNISFGESNSFYVVRVCQPLKTFKDYNIITINSCFAQNFFHDEVEEIIFYIDRTTGTTYFVIFAGTPISNIAEKTRFFYWNTKSFLTVDKKSVSVFLSQLQV